MTNDNVKTDINVELASAIRGGADSCPRLLTPCSSRAWWDKKIIEVDAVRDLVDGLRSDGRRDIREVVARHETRPQTPPDVLARNEHGGLIGIEVTELTDQELIEENIPRSMARYGALQTARSPAEHAEILLRQPERVRLWSGREALDRVVEIIAEKDAKAFATDGGPCAERWLVIHTAEWCVEWEEFRSALRACTIGPLRQLDFVYLVRDLDPFTGGYPWWLICSRSGVATP